MKKEKKEVKEIKEVKKEKERIVNITFSGETPFALSNKGKMYKFLNGAWVPFNDGL